MGTGRLPDGRPVIMLEVAGDPAQTNLRREVKPIDFELVLDQVINGCRDVDLGQK